MSDVGIYILIVFSILAEGIGRGEIIGFPNTPGRVIRPEQRVKGMIEKTERIGFVSREGFEIELPVIQWGNAARTGHPDHAVRPEKTAVGVYHPPLPIYFLNPELTCCLELRAIGPAAPAVPLGRSRIICQLLFFRNSGLLQILVTVDFTLPVSVHVLSVPVHKREELTPVHLHDSRDSALTRQERDIGNDVFHILVALHRRNGYVTDIT